MRGLTREAKAKLLRYPWPGNVRELQHTMERAVILGDGSLLRPDNFLFQASSPRPKTVSYTHLKCGLLLRTLLLANTT